ncbi:MAG: hypothetical protein ACT4OI_05905 [Methanobacteriota archaeon]
MPSDVRVAQRRLVGLDVQARDAELATKYVFPFVDADWRTAFVVLVVLGSAPRLHRGPLRFEGTRLVADVMARDLRPVEAVPVAEFAGLAHLDPWWAFRGIGGVLPGWVRAIVATNLAGSFDRGGARYEVHDLVFDGSLSRLEAVVAKDDAFRSATFSQRDINLAALRKGHRVSG